MRWPAAGDRLIPSGGTAGAAAPPSGATRCEHAIASTPQTGTNARRCGPGTAEQGYPTPKVDVRTAVFSEGRVLLVQEWLDGGWTLPGGWADEGDSPREAAERECREESGYEVVVRKLVALRDRSRHPYQPRNLGGIYKVLFLADVVGGQAQVSEETTDVGFFALDQLPPLSLARTLPEDIALAYRHQLDAARPTEFD